MVVAETRKSQFCTKIHLAPPGAVVEIPRFTRFQNMVPEIQVWREVVRVSRTVEGEAVRPAGICLPKESHRQRESLGKLVSPGSGEGEAMLNVVVRRRENILLRVEEGALLVVGKRHRAGHWLHVFGIVVGITNGEVETIFKGLGETNRDGIGLRGLVAVGQHEASLARLVVDRIAVRIRTDPIDIAVQNHCHVFSPRVQEVGAEYIVRRKYVGEAQRKLPLLGQFKSRIQVIDLVVVSRAPSYVIM